MPTNWSPGLRAQVALGGAPVAVLEGSSFSMPRNLSIPNVFTGNNLYQYVYVEGLQYPTVSLNTIITRDWFIANTINGWFTRVSDDVASAGTLAFWDGTSGWQASASKVGMLSIGGSMGQMMRCRLVIIGYGTLTAISAKPSATALSQNPTSFQHVGFSGGLASGAADAKSLAGFDLVLNNNLDMCPEFNGGTTMPAEFNSGQLTGTLRIVKQAAATRLADGASSVITVTPGGSGGTPVSFTIPNPVCLDPNERAVQFPRIMREYNYALLGNAAPDASIISIA